MSTRSLIAIEKEDNTIDVVYCHSDGYPSHNGSLLLKHYNSKEDAEKIISLGDLSFLDEKLNPEKELDNCRYDHRELGLVKHSFDTPHDKVTTAYHRDRGEKLNIHHFENESELNSKIEDFWADYIYLWKDDKWHVDGEILTVKMTK